MERTFIKNNFVGFAHRVAPLQKVFHKECPDVYLDTDVLEFFCGLQNELVGKMMDGACALSQHRRSKDVVAEDLLCHLDIQWNLDPLIMSANCIKTYYRVTETTDQIDFSAVPIPLPIKKRTRRSSNLPKVPPAPSKVKKKSARNSKPNSKCEQSTNIVSNKSKVKSKHRDKFPEQSFKIQPQILNKKPELKAKKQHLIKASSTDSLVKFFGNKYTPDISNVVGVPGPSAIVPISQPKSEAKKKIPVCEKNPPLKGKSEKIPVWYSLNSETNTHRIAGIRQDTTAYVPKSFEALKVDEQSSTCVIVPSKEKIKPKINVPTFCFHSETHTVKTAGLNQDAFKAGVISKSPEVPIWKSKSKVEKNKLICENPIKALSFKEKTELVVPPQIHFDQETLTDRKTAIEDFSKKSSEAYIHKLNVEEEMLTCEHSTDFSLKEKVQSELKLTKLASTEMPCLDSQILKLPGKKGKQRVSGMKCASVETLEEERKPSVEMPHSVSHVHKISLKRSKQEVPDINNIHIETPEEARRRLAIVLLRIAGRY